MSKTTNKTQKETASSADAQTVLSFERALVGFPPYEEAVSLFNEGVKAGKVTEQRQKEWKALVATPIPLEPHTSTTLFCLMANKWGGQVLPPKLLSCQDLAEKVKEAK